MEDKTHTHTHTDISIKLLSTAILRQKMRVTFRDPFSWLLILLRLGACPQAAVLSLFTNSRLLIIPSVAGCPSSSTPSPLFWTTLIGCLCLHGLMHTLDRKKSK